MDEDADVVEGEEGERAGVAGQAGEVLLAVHAVAGAAEGVGEGVDAALGGGVVGDLHEALAAVHLPDVLQALEERRRRRTDRDDIRGRRRRRRRGDGVEHGGRGVDAGGEGGGEAVEERREGRRVEAERPDAVGDEEGPRGPALGGDDEGRLPVEVDAARRA